VSQGRQDCDVTRTVNLTAEKQAYLVGFAGTTCSFLSGPMGFDAPWIRFLSTHGNGVQLEVLIDLNTDTERTGHVTTALGIITIVQGPGNCVTAIAPASQAFDENGGSGSFNVTAVPGCPWEATPRDDSSYTLFPYHGIGSGIVTFNVPLNGGPYTRSPYFIVGGRLRFQITQSACVLKCGLH
jgi:hypothetical protein